MRRLFIIAGVVVLSACTYIAPPIRLEGSLAEWEQLAGEWTGTYWGSEPGSRSGHITFDLMAGADHAHGDVLMFAEGSDSPYERHPYSWPGRQRPAQYMSKALTIRFVRLLDGRLRGELDSYWDPDRDCVATSVFRGRAGRQAMEGTFVSTCDGPRLEVRGSWQVTRRTR